MGRPGPWMRRARTSLSCGRDLALDGIRTRVLLARVGYGAGGARNIACRSVPPDPARPAGRSRLGAGQPLGRPDAGRRVERQGHRDAGCGPAPRGHIPHRTRRRQVPPPQEARLVAVPAELGRYQPQIASLLPRQPPRLCCTGQLTLHAAGHPRGVGTLGGLAG